MDFNFPQLPGLPGLPQLPQLPKLPQLPSVPNLPNIGNLGSFNNAVNNFIEQNNAPISIQNPYNPFNDPNRYRSLADVLFSRKLYDRDQNTSNFLEDIGDWFSDNIVRNIPIVGEVLEDALDSTIETVWDTAKDIPILGEFPRFVENTGKYIINLPERLVGYVNNVYVEPLQWGGPKFMIMSIMNAIGKDADYITGANLIKSILIPTATWVVTGGKEGNLNVLDNIGKSIGLDAEAGLTHYEWETGWLKTKDIPILGGLTQGLVDLTEDIKDIPLLGLLYDISTMANELSLVDFILEVASSPDAWLSFGTSEAVESLVKKMSKTALGNLIEIGEAFRKAGQTALDKLKIREIRSDLVQAIQRKGKIEAFTDYYYNTIINNLNNKEFIKGLSDGEFDKYLKTLSTYVETSQEYLDASTALKEIIRSNIESLFTESSDNLARQGIKHAFEIADTWKRISDKFESIQELAKYNNPITIANKITGVNIPKTLFKNIINKYNEIKIKKAKAIPKNSVYYDDHVFTKEEQELLDQHLEVVMKEYIKALPKEYRDISLDTYLEMYQAAVDKVTKLVKYKKGKLSDADVHRLAVKEFINRLEKTFGITLKDSVKRLLTEIYVKDIKIKNKKDLKFINDFTTFVDNLRTVRKAQITLENSVANNIKTYFFDLHNTLAGIHSNFKRLSYIKKNIFKGQSNLSDYKKFFKQMHKEDSLADIAIEEFEHLLNNMKILPEDLRIIDAILDLNSVNLNAIKTAFRKSKQTDQQLYDMLLDNIQYKRDVLINMSNIEKYKHLFRDRKMKMRDPESLTPLSRAAADLFSNDVLETVQLDFQTRIDYALESYGLYGKGRAKTVKEIYKKGNRYYKVTDNNARLNGARILGGDLAKQNQAVENVTKAFEDLFSYKDYKKIFKKRKQEARVSAFEEFVDETIAHLEQLQQALKVGRSSKTYSVPSFASINQLKKLYKKINQALHPDNVTKVISEEEFSELITSTILDNMLPADIVLMLEDLQEVRAFVKNVVDDIYELGITPDFGNEFVSVEFKELLDHLNILLKESLKNSLEEVANTTDKLYKLKLANRVQYLYAMEQITNNEKLNKALYELTDPSTTIRQVLDNIVAEVSISNDPVLKNIGLNIDALISKTQGFYNYVDFYNDLQQILKNNKQLPEEISTVVINEIQNILVNSIYTADKAVAITTDDLMPLMDELRDKVMKTIGSHKFLNKLKEEDREYMEELIKQEIYDEICAIGKRIDGDLFNKKGVKINFYKNIHADDAPLNNRNRFNIESITISPDASPEVQQAIEDYLQTRYPNSRIITDGYTFKIKSDIPSYELQTVVNKQRKHIPQFIWTDDKGAQHYDHTHIITYQYKDQKYIRSTNKNYEQVYKKDFPDYQWDDGTVNYINDLELEEMDYLIWYRENALPFILDDLMSQVEHALKIYIKKQQQSNLPLFYFFDHDNIVQALTVMDGLDELFAYLNKINPNSEEELGAYVYGFLNIFQGNDKYAKSFKGKLNDYAERTGIEGLEEFDDLIGVNATLTKDVWDAIDEINKDLMNYGEINPDNLDINPFSTVAQYDVVLKEITGEELYPDLDELFAKDNIAHIIKLYRKEKGKKPKLNAENVLSLQLRYARTKNRFLKSKEDPTNTLVNQAYFKMCEAYEPLLTKVLKGMAPTDLRCLKWFMQHTDELSVLLHKFEQTQGSYKKQILNYYDLFSKDFVKELETVDINYLISRLSWMSRDATFASELFPEIQTQLFTIFGSDTYNQELIESIVLSLGKSQEEATRLYYRLNNILHNRGKEYMKKDLLRYCLETVEDKAQLMAWYTTVVNNEDLYKVLTTFDKTQKVSGNAAGAYLHKVTSTVLEDEQTKELITAGAYIEALELSKLNLDRGGVFTKNAKKAGTPVHGLQGKINESKTIAASIASGKASYDLLISLNKKLKPLYDNYKRNKYKNENHLYNMEELINDLQIQTLLSLDANTLGDFIRDNYGVVYIQADDLEIPWTKQQLKNANLDIRWNKNNEYVIYNTDMNYKYNKHIGTKQFANIKCETYRDVLDDINPIKQKLSPYTNMETTPFGDDLFIPRTFSQEAAEDIFSDFNEIQNMYLNPYYFNNQYSRIDNVRFIASNYRAVQQSYGLNYQTTLTLYYQNLIKNADMKVKYIDNVFRQEVFEPQVYKELLEDCTDDEIEMFFKENKLTGTVISTSTKGDVAYPKCDVIKIRSRKDLQLLIDHPDVAAIVPKNMAVNMLAAINDHAADSRIIELLRLINYTWKVGIIAKPGQVLRNKIDAMIKNMNETGNNAAEEIHKLKVASALNNLYDEIYEKTMELYGDITYKKLDSTLDSMLANADLTEAQIYTIKNMMYLVNELNKASALDSDINVLQKIQQEFNKKYLKGFKKASKEYIDLIQTRPYIKQMLDANNSVERNARLSLALSELNAGKSIEQIIEKIDNVHFNYADKSPALQKAELFIPFNIFPIKNLSYWLNGGFKTNNLYRTLYIILKQSWSDETGTFGQVFYRDKDGNVAIDPYAVQAVTSGSIRLGDHIIKTGWSFLDAMNLIYNPLDELRNRVNPVIGSVLSGGQDQYSLYSMIPFIGPEIYRLARGQGINRALTGNMFTNDYTIRTQQKNYQRPRYSNNYYKYPKSNRRTIRYGKYPKVTYKAMHGSNRSVAFKRYYGKVRIPYNIYKSLYPKNKYAIVNLRKWQAQNPSYYWSNTKNIVSNVKRIKSMYR